MAVSTPFSARRRNLAAVIAAMAMVNLIMGISFPLLALILERQGIAPALIGINTAAQAASVFLVAPFARRLIAWAGPARVMLGGLLAAACALALLPVFMNVYAWFPIRLLLGAAGSLLWMTSEAWISEMAPERSRGRIIGIYASAGAAGFALGPVILILTGTQNATPFVIGTGFLLLGAAIIATADRGTAHLSSGTARRPWRLLLIAPAPLLVNLFYAAADESINTFFPLYALRFGVAEQASLFLLTCAAVGAIALQVPIGWAADRFNRYAQLFGYAAVSIAGYCLLPLALPDVAVTAVAVFLLGGLSHGVYTMGLVLLGQRFSGTDLATASAISTTMWGVGALIGAPLSGTAFGLWEPHGLIAAIVAIYAAYLPFALFDWSRNRRGKPA